MTMIVVNLEDESITDLDNSVVVDWDTDGDWDTEDVVHYASAHGRRLADMFALVRTVAGAKTMDEIIADLDDPDDPDQVLEAEQEAKHNGPDDLDSWIIAAREVLGHYAPTPAYKSRP